MRKKEKRKIGKIENRTAITHEFQPATVKKVLDKLYASYDQTFIPTDPIVVVRECTEPADQEIMAVVMSALAFGQASQIIRAGRAILKRMDYHPHRYVESLRPQAELERWKDFYYRMIRGSDLLRLLFALQSVLKQFSSLFDWFQSHRRKDDVYLIHTWARAIRELHHFDLRRWKWKKENGFTHLLPDPQKGSACKRPNLMLRWLVRHDQIDLGLWISLPPSALIIPLDTHVHRIALNLGLTTLRTPSFAAAESITESLRQMDPDDPVKYDFALSRLGIVNDCPRQPDILNCAKCLIKHTCRHGYRLIKK